MHSCIMGKIQPYFNPVVIATKILNLNILCPTTIPQLEVYLMKMLFKYAKIYTVSSREKFEITQMIINRAYLNFGSHIQCNSAAIKEDAVELYTLVRKDVFLKKRK